ncbi:MAG: dCTP deaminase [Candidatus Zixiibacteriota bacterium]|nr:MAG: dCTP deaminase [candidate division Zixibacteria bacterium]
MGVKPDRWIVDMARRHKMIEPFAETQVREGISYGVSSYGYDISLADEFLIFDPGKTSEIDPKKGETAHFIKKQAASVVIPPNSFILARSREYFRIPRDVITICTGKSTYARSGVIVNVTPFEPEWEGFATISLANTSPVPVRIYANEGIGQLIFLEASEPCQVSYKEKKGKYQAQQEITVSRSD